MNIFIEFYKEQKYRFENLEQPGKNKVFTKLNQPIDYQ